MAILVTGGAGYIGSHMVLDLLDAGEKPVVLDDLSTGFEAAVPGNVNLFTGDCGDGALLDKIMRTRQIDAVLHFAASAILPESVTRPLAYYSNNTVKSRALIDACVRNRVRNFIFSSTAAVYGTPGTEPLREEDAVNPPSPYGRSKYIVEWMLEDAAAAYDFSFVALRYFNVAGADPAGRAGQSSKRATNLIKVVAQAALGLRPYLEIFGNDYPTRDGTGVRDYIHVTDLVSAHSAALKHLRKGGGPLILNCGYGHGYSVREVVAAAEAQIGHSIPIQVSPRRPGDLSEVIAANQKIRQTLAWTPQHDDLNLIVRTAIDWERRINAQTHGVRAIA